MKFPKLVFLSLLLFPLVAAAQVDKPTTLAVFDFEASDAEGQTGSDASALLVGLLSETDSLALVERSELSKILGETELGLSGTVDSETAVKVGKLTGAKILVTGRLFRIGETGFVSTKVISTETGRVFAQVEKYNESSDLIEAMSKLSGKISKVVHERKGDLFVVEESPEARMDRLEKLVHGKDLPSVYIKISEEHITRLIPDPAAQTEIQKIFQDLGFSIVDNEGSAGFVIIGEAFSELAGRRASLVSCRARVEVLTRKKAKENEVRVDRETAVAVDLAENIAAKKALQMAGGLLAERLILLATD